MDRGRSHAGYNVYTAVIDGRRYTFRRRRTQSVAADDNTSNKRARVAGATEAAIQGLPVVTPSKLLLMQSECAVCLTDFDAEDNKLRAMPCAHAFHEQCIFQWLRCKASCPLCRQHLPPPTTTTKDKDDDETAQSPAAAQPEDPILSSATRQDD